MNQVTSDQDYSQQVLTRLHHMARIRICNEPECETCMTLPVKKPTEITAQNNILVRMRMERIEMQRQQELAENQPVPRMDVGPKTTTFSNKNKPALPMCEGVVWAKADKRYSHAFKNGDNISMCSRFRRIEAVFDRLGPNPCRECKMHVLRANGRDVYLAGGKIIERTDKGLRKVVRWDQ